MSGQGHKFFWAWENAFTPENLALSLYNEAGDYSVAGGAGNWPGRASAGLSLNRNMASAIGEAPTVSSDLAPTFDLVASKLVSSPTIGWSSLITANEGSIIVCANITDLSAASNDPTYYVNAPLLGTTSFGAFFGIYLRYISATEFRIQCGANLITLSDGINKLFGNTKFMVAMRWSTVLGVTTLESSINNGAWITDVTTPLNLVGVGPQQNLNLGRRFAGTVRLNACMQSKITDDELDALYAYAQANALA